MLIIAPKTNNHDLKHYMNAIKKEGTAYIYLTHHAEGLMESDPAISQNPSKNE